MKDDTRFLIIGLGLLGGSYAQGLKKKAFMSARWISIRTASTTR